MKSNPAKVKAWFDKAQEVRHMSDSLYNFAEELKLAIVREADGKNGDVKNIKGKEDLEAATQVMLAPGTGKGTELYKSINSFRERILAMVSDSVQRSVIESNLATQIPANAMSMGKNWQEYMFEGMPWQQQSRCCRSCRATYVMPREKCCTLWWPISMSRTYV